MLYGFGDDAAPTIPGLPAIPGLPTQKPELPGYVTSESCAAQLQAASSFTGPNLVKFALAAGVGAALCYFLKK